MRFLLYGTQLTSAVSDALRRHEHTPVTLAEVEMPADPARSAVLETAQRKQLDLLTTDQELAVASFSEGAKVFGRSIVFINLEGGDVEQDDAIDRLFARYSRLTPGRLYTVTGSRVKIRQLPTRPRSSKT